MSEWREYTGSDEQIAEMENAQYGVLFEGIDEILDVSDMVDLAGYLNEHDVHSYWIIPDDPLREMKIRQAQTGQPVWIKWLVGFQGSENSIYEYECTCNPRWDQPNAEYAFTEFKD